MFPVDPNYLHCTISLYPSVQDARDGKGAGGSGFLVSVPSARHPHLSHILAVTNRHVVAKGQRFDPAPVIRMNTIGGGVDVVPLTPEHWIEHPQGDDLSVAYLKAANLGGFKYETVPLDRFITDPTPPRDGQGPYYDGTVWIGAPCILVGRFMNHEGRQQNTPAVRFGNVSMFPHEPIRNPETGFLQESFLVEVHSIGGFSGSPVFMVVGGASPWQGGLARLLGVDWGHIKTRLPVRLRGEDGHSERTPCYVEANSGQATVIPAWKLRELLMESPKVNDAMRTEDMRIARELDDAAVELDAAGELSPDDVGSPQRGPEPERLKIDATFEDAARKLTRTPRPEGGWPKDG